MKNPYPLVDALTQLYLSQEHTRGLDEASALESMLQDGTDSPSSPADQSEESTSAALLHEGMSDGTLETHQMVQRSYGLY
ncbi:hypothetical protein [Paenibacillus sp. OSY-SE]|uniref:hypothetical protein n=1 Tax=Paenibacillus sp. OSY-SE TaxID=1196323 RepID=UPI0002F85692|nr:hypothetical protein [Paenibacillus sp. OSY-SE]